MAWAAVALYGAGGLVLWVAPGWRPGWDSASYLLTARSVFLGEGYTYQGEPFFLRPPGFAWLLSLVWSGSSAGSARFDPWAANALVQLCATATLAALLACLRPLVGLRSAAVTVALVAFSPLFVHHLNAVLSEFPFLAAFLFGVAALHVSAGRGRAWWVASIGGALLLAAAIHLRTVGVLVLPCVGLLGWRRERGLRRWRALLPVALVVCLAAPWFVHARAAAAIAPTPADQLLLHDYATALLHVDPGDPASELVSPAGWFERLRANGAAALGSLTRTTVHTDGLPARLVVLVLVLAGLVRAVRRRPSLLEGFFVLYTVLVLGYFVHDSRLVLPLVPLAYLYGADAFVAGFAFLRERARVPAWAAPLPVVCLVALLAANLARLPRSLDPGQEVVGRFQIGERWQDMERVAAWLRDETPENARILCFNAPALELLSGRRAYTYRFIHRFPDVDPLARYDVDFVVFDAQGVGNLQGYVEQRALERWAIPSHVEGRTLPVYRVSERDG